MIATLPPNQLAAPGPTTVTIGSLCTGYAGLDMGVAAALNGNARLLWTADNDPHITRLLTHRLPDAPNLGNLAAVRWASLETPQVLTAGFPCQDVSAAGHGAGIEKEGFTRAPHTALRGHRYPHQRPHPEAAAAPFAYAWGAYEAAIQRWEKVLGRAAPVPTEPGTRGQPRLSAALVEWMMGLPPGWVTDPGLALPRAAQLQAFGNGVVPQQACAAVRRLLAQDPDAAFFGESG